MMMIVDCFMNFVTTFIYVIQSVFCDIVYVLLYEITGIKGYEPK